MNDLKLDGLTGKTIKEAEVDGFGIRMVFTDGAVFDYDASDGGYSQYELTEATADAMQKQIDHTADIGKKVSISCGRENDLISRQEALKELAAYIHLIDKTMGKGTLTDDDCMEAAKSVLGEDELPAVQPDRDVIDDCLYHIYKNISVHTATGGVIAIKYYMEKLYEEIYGEGGKPWWMT